MDGARRNLKLGELAGFGGGGDSGAGGGGVGGEVSAMEMPSSLEALRNQGGRDMGQEVGSSSASLPASLTSSPLKKDSRLAGSRLLTWTPDKTFPNPNNNYQSALSPPPPQAPHPLLANLGTSPANAATNANSSQPSPMGTPIKAQHSLAEAEALEAQAHKLLQHATAIRSALANGGRMASFPPPTSPAQTKKALMTTSPYTTSSWKGMKTLPFLHQPQSNLQLHLPVLPNSPALSPMQHQQQGFPQSPWKEEMGMGLSGGSSPGQFRFVSHSAYRPPRPNWEERNRLQRMSMEETLRRLEAGGSDREGVTTRAIVQLVEPESSTLPLSLVTDAQIRELVREREGSRWLQRRLNEEGSAALQRLSSVLLPEFGELVNHRYANYVLQKMIEAPPGGWAGVEGGQWRVLGEVVRRLPGLAEEMHGCRVLQRALSIVAVSPALPHLLQAMSGHVYSMIKSQFGNHVVQKVIDILGAEERSGGERASGEGLAWVVAEVTAKGSQGLLDLSTDVYGCRVLQKLLQESPACVSVAAPMFDLLQGSIVDLAVDEYGNYVIQHLMARAPEDLVDAMGAELMGRVAILAQHEYASHVVERAMIHSSKKQRRVLIEEVLSSGTVSDHRRSSSALEICLMDQFGNYVVQVMLKTAEPAQRSRMEALILRHRQQLSKYTFGQQILSKLEGFGDESISSPSKEESIDVAIKEITPTYLNQSNTKRQS